MIYFLYRKTTGEVISRSQEPFLETEKLGVYAYEPTFEEEQKMEKGSQIRIHDNTVFFSETPEIKEEKKKIEIMEIKKMVEKGKSIEDLQQSLLTLINLLTVYG